MRLISPQGIVNSNMNVNYNLGSGEIINNNQIHAHILSSGMPAGSATEQVSSTSLLVLPPLLIVRLKKINAIQSCKIDLSVLFDEAHASQ